MRMGHRSNQNGKNNIAASCLDYFRAFVCSKVFGYSKAFACTKASGYSRAFGSSKVFDYSKVTGRSGTSGHSRGSMFCKLSDFDSGKGSGGCQKTERKGRKNNTCCRSVIVSAAAFSAICMIIICTTLCSSLRSNANNGFKYYTSIIVQPGETLWELADQYMDYENYKDKQSYISEVMSINHLEEDMICAGQMLVVPYYSSEYIY